MNASVEYLRALRTRTPFDWEDDFADEWLGARVAAAVVLETAQVTLCVGAMERAIEKANGLAGGLSCLAASAACYEMAKLYVRTGAYPSAAREYIEGVRSALGKLAED